MYGFKVANKPLSAIRPAIVLHYLFSVKLFLNCFSLVIKKKELIYLSI